VTRITVFGAGAMGTAIAMHLARSGNDTTLWASEFDAGALGTLTRERRHPALPGHLPESLRVMAPDELKEAAEGADFAVMGAHSGGARTLARIVARGAGELPLVVSLAKGLEPETLKRMSEVYSEEIGHERIVAVGGPGLAPEIAEGLPTSIVMAAQRLDVAEKAARAFRSTTFRVRVTDDVAGVEYSAVAKNVAAIGIGIVDGLAKVSGQELRNAKAALFTQAFHELEELVEALGGRASTVRGLAGLGDTLVTSLGGRNRLFGELVGEGQAPEAALATMEERGMTVEGWDSARDIGHLAAETDGVGSLPFLTQVHRILFGSSPARSLLDRLKG
jgi:glycerol-3-phosphate dehydrogenase (NAD(P)+)